MSQQKAILLIKNPKISARITEMGTHLSKLRQQEAFLLA